MSRTKTTKAKRKHDNKRNTLERLETIPKSFLLPKQITTKQIREGYRAQIKYDEDHRLYSQSWWSECHTNPIFTSRNSHKQTNKK